MPAILELEHEQDEHEIVREVLPDRYEVIDGQIVEMPEMSIIANKVASRLLIKIGEYALRNNLGEATMEGLFHLPAPVERNRRPDLCYISYERWPAQKPYSARNAQDVVPDLAVEVVSPGDSDEENREKIFEYFQAGVRQVWVVYPKLQLVYVYNSITEIKGYTIDDIIDVDAVIPGLKINLREVIPAYEKG